MMVYVLYVFLFYTEKGINPPANSHPNQKHGWYYFRFIHQIEMGGYIDLWPFWDGERQQIIENRQNNLSGTSFCCVLSVWPYKIFKSMPHTFPFVKPFIKSAHCDGSCIDFKCFYFSLKGGNIDFWASILADPLESAKLMLFTCQAPAATQP